MKPGTAVHSAASSGDATDTTWLEPRHPSLESKRASHLHSNESRPRPQPRSHSTWGTESASKISMAKVLLNRSEIDLISSRSMRMAISWPRLGAPAQRWFPHCGNRLPRRRRVAPHYQRFPSRPTPGFPDPEPAEWSRCLQPQFYQPADGDRVGSFKTIHFGRGGC